jgi:hypothetical protein
MKPVAWKSTLQTDWYISKEKMIEGKYDANYWIPLYNAPRKLSDEEILEELLIPKSEWEGYKAQVCLKQVRAILKKAS